MHMAAALTILYGWHGALIWGERERPGYLIIAFALEEEVAVGCIPCTNAWCVERTLV